MGASGEKSKKQGLAEEPIASTYEWQTISQPEEFSGYVGAQAAYLEFTKKVPTTRREDGAAD